MAQQEDLQTAIEKIQSSLIERTESIVTALSAAENVNPAAAQWVEYANQLQRLVPDYAIPSWLTDACSTFGEGYRGIPKEQVDIANFVTSRAPEIKVPIQVGEAATLDLEQLFAEQSARFHLDEVLENLVSRLAELIEADVIDNRIIHDSLTRLNALFRRTKRGSLATVLLTMNFGRFFLNSFGGVLKANKYAKPIIENFEKEFAEASATVQKAEEETKKEMISKLINSARMELFLDSNPDLRETVGGFLPAPRTAEPEDQSEAN